MCESEKLLVNVAVGGRCVCRRFMLTRLLLLLLVGLVKIDFASSSCGASGGGFPRGPGRTSPWPGCGFHPWSKSSFGRSLVGVAGANFFKLIVVRLKCAAMCLCGCCVGFLARFCSRRALSRRFGHQRCQGQTKAQAGWLTGVFGQMFPTCFARWSFRPWLKPNAKIASTPTGTSGCMWRCNGSIQNRTTRGSASSWRFSSQTFAPSSSKAVLWRRAGVWFSGPVCDVDTLLRLGRSSVGAAFLSKKPKRSRNHRTDRVPTYRGNF